MEILLNEFEHQIDETILRRGFDYCKKGYVTEVDELGGGNYEITVEGSDIYTVRLSIKGNAVTEFECDFPSINPDNQSRISSIPGYVLY